MRLTNPAEVRATIAAHILGIANPDQRLGEVTLHNHQIVAIERIREIIQTHCGALLADEVGLGKTFVALAVAAPFERVTVVGPASLRAMWRQAATRAGVRIRFLSMELLGHGGTVPITDFIIVDEAHHFRNSGTKRYGKLAEACSRATVLLLSATPVQNELHDLRRLLALVIGQRAFALDVASLCKLIVRRNTASIQTTAKLPDVLPPQSICIESDDCLDELCALPSPVPPSDGGQAQALLTLSLVRQWASSRSALLGALTRRLAMARAMEDALAAGRHLSRSELALWRFADGAQQLAFPVLAAPSSVFDPGLVDHVREHADAIRLLIAQLKDRRDIDELRAERLRAIANRHPGERIVAFAEFTETVAALYRHLSRTLRVAMLTHGGGRVAGGPLTRQEVLAQFGPGAIAPEHARIDLLLTTDVLSEGVDLQGASAVVHLDLTWNPARMEQRVGRLRRLGAATDSIAVYVFSPPAPAERLLQLDRRLRDKLAEAARSVGITGAILPGITPANDSTVSQRERVMDVLRTWSATASLTSTTPCAAVCWDKPGAIACVRSAGEVVLIVLMDGRINVDPHAELLRDVAAQDSAECRTSELDAARREIERWMERRSLTRTIDGSASSVARSRRAILNRLNGIAGRARRHERGALNAMLGAARQAVTVTMPAGAERVLSELAGAQLPDDAWLRAIGEFSSIHGRAAPQKRDEILALLLLQPPE